MTPSSVNDIFLSYSHNDNEAIGFEGRQWVSQFRKDLAARLGGYLGRKATVWMDPRQPGEIDYAKDIEAQLKTTAVLVAVLSPSYIQSDWCKRELSNFVGLAGATGGLFIQNGCRVLKVYKMPVARRHVSEIEPALDPPIGFKFFELDTERNIARELFIHENPEVRRLYDPRVDDVAQAAFRVISDMGLAERARPSPTKGAVYLAETTEDLSDSVLKLRRELEDRGYDILPRVQLPVHASDTRAAIENGLQQALCSIHLFGGRAGWIPEGETRSVVRLQHDLAAQRHVNGFSRVLWIPQGLEPSESAQAAFLDELRDAPGARNDFELAEVSFEELKAIVLEKLKVPAAPKAVRPRARRLYVVCAPEDDAAVTALQSSLIDRGLEVDVPLRSGDPAVDHDDHIQTLNRCDVVAILWATSTLAWVRQQQRILRDTRESMPAPPASCLVVGGPDTADKQRFRAQELALVRLDGDDIEPLASLVMSDGRQPETGR